MRHVWIVVAVSCLYPFASPAEDTTELLNRMKAMEDKIKALEAEVQELKGQQSALTAAVTAASPAPAASPQPVTPQVPTVAPQAAPGGFAAPETPVGPLPVYGGASAAASKVFNPDISVIGDFLGGRRERRPPDRRPRSKCTRARSASRRSSTPTRAPISSSASASKA